MGDGISPLENSTANVSFGHPLLLLVIFLAVYRYTSLRRTEGALSATTK